MTKKKILLGESEAWAIDLFRHAADRAGVELHVARNGVEAIEMFKTLLPSLVVVDTLLPKLDGLKVAAKLREMELGRITPVIVSSAIYGSQDVERLRASFGFTSFLAKPFRAEEVDRLLADHLHDELEAPAADDEVREDGQPLEHSTLVEEPLAALGVPTLLCQLHRGKKTGILTVRQGEITKTVFFDNGDISHARSNSRRDRLGRILQRSKRISPEDYERARQLQVESRGHLPLGQALVTLGVLDENDVVNAVSCQILNVVFSLFGYRDGTYSFLETANLPPEYSRFHFNTGNVIFWGLRQLEGIESFDRVLPGPKTIVQQPPDAARLRDGLHLTYFEEQILGLVDGQRRLGEILSIGRLAHVDVARVLFSFLVLGVVQVGNPGEDEAEFKIGEGRVIEGKGTLAQTSVARLFSRIYLSQASGTVSLKQVGQDAEVFFDGGEIIYARSSREDLRLGQILLRAGKVTHEDYEQATATLAAHPEKRIGSIFLDLRALSLAELDWALRFQVQAIVLDLFAWRDGDYAFTEGEPAVDFMIRLEATTPNLIMEGVRKAPAPPGVVGVLHTPEALLMKVWGDDRVTGAMRLSSAERRLLSYIEAGRTVREVRSLDLMNEECLARSLHGFFALEVVRVTGGASSRRDEESRVLFRPDFAAAPAGSHSPSPGPAPVPEPAAPAAFDGEESAERPVAAAGVATALSAIDTNAVDPTRIIAENERLVRENHELNAAVRLLEQEIASIREAIVRYHDLKEGRGSGMRALQRILADLPGRPGRPAGGFN